jgi:hypothetical protein
MSPFQRRLALYGVLAVFVALAIWAPQGDAGAPATLPVRAAGPAPLVSAHAPAPQQNAGPGSIRLDKLARTFVAVDEGNPFGVRSWMPAAPPPVAAAAPAPAPAPTAPPLPFTFAGKLEVAPGKWVVYLAKGEQSYAVSKGDTFDGNYRFEGIEDGKLVFVYLPLTTRQLLPIGAES